MSRIFRFTLGLYARDIAVHSENTAARISFVAGMLSAVLVVIGFCYESSSAFVFAAVLGGVAVGFGASGLIHRNELLTTKYVHHPDVNSLRLGYKKSCAGILLGAVGVGTGIYFY